MKGIALLKFLSKFISTYLLNISHKLYVRPPLDYGDVLYHNQGMEIRNHETPYNIYDQSPATREAR